LVLGHKKRKLPNRYFDVAHLARAKAHPPPLVW
jgi:hypothetical protein